MSAGQMYVFCFFAHSGDFGLWHDTVVKGSSIEARWLELGY